MTDSEIDDAILAVAEPRWRKVARIILDAADRLGPGLPDGEAGYVLVGKRIGVLVSQRRLVAYGDVNNWRHSQVRLP